MTSITRAPHERRFYDHFFRKRQHTRQLKSIDWLSILSFALFATEIRVSPPLFSLRPIRNYGAAINFYAIDWSTIEKSPITGFASPCYVTAGAGPIRTLRFQYPDFLILIAISLTRQLRRSNRNRSTLWSEDEDDDRGEQRIAAGPMCGRRSWWNAGDAPSSRIKQPRSPARRPTSKMTSRVRLGSGRDSTRPSTVAVLFWGWCSASRNGA